MIQNTDRQVTTTLTECLWPRNSDGAFTTGQRSAKGSDSVHCRYAACGNTSIRGAAVSCPRRAAHDGHHPRVLQENATSVVSAQVSHAATRNPRCAPAPGVGAHAAVAFPVSRLPSRGRCRLKRSSAR